MICNGNPAEYEINKAFHLVQSLQNNHSCVKSIKVQELPKATLALISKVSLLHSDPTSPFITSIHGLKWIDFSYNNMKINERFTDFLQNCSQVEFQNLEGNSIFNDTFLHLATGLLFTGKLSLSNLRIMGNPCMENSKNGSVLQMIETLRADISKFECSPAEFEYFLTVLEIVDGVNKKPNFVANTISLIKILDFKYFSSNQQIILQSTDVINLCKHLKYFESLECINMIGNNIQEDVKDALAIAVLKNYRITKIELEENPICKVKECFRLFNTIGEMRTHGNAYPFKDHQKNLKP